MVEDTGEPEKRYMPGHPDADQDGYVAFPRVNPAEDMADLHERRARLSRQCRGHDRDKKHDSQSIDLLK